MHYDVFFSFALVVPTNDDELRRYSQQRQWIQECRSVSFNIWFFSKLSLASSDNDKKVIYIFVHIAIFIFTISTLLPFQMEWMEWNGMGWDRIAQFDFKLQRKLRSSQGGPKGVMTIEIIDRMRAPISCQLKNCRHKMADLQGQN